MKLIVSVPSQYGSPVLKSLSPQLVSVQSARRFFLFAFRIPGQHHGPKLRDPPLRFLKRPALVFFDFGWRGGRDFRGGDPIGVEETSCCSMALIGEWKSLIGDFSANNVQSLPQPDDIGYVIEGIVYFARQINLEMDSDDAEELLDSQNQELTIDEFIEINDEELESF
ncbi:uncharacterized protein TNCV_1818261 [Trichonephila clavipes]|nr:uncharacterized protein TNCV_1818261 [Trichonephila clavipes]